MLHALGPKRASRAQLVFLPPDKANIGWWGPQRSLWAAFSRTPPLSFVEWVRQVSERERGPRAATHPVATHQMPHHKPTSSHRPLDHQQRHALLAVPHAVFALSGLHSVYGRGAVGRALEATCEHCAQKRGASAPLARVSAFYRPFLGLALQHAGLLFLPHRSAAGERAPLHGVWISRGKGLGGGYGKTVKRLCLNEPQVLTWIAHPGLRAPLQLLYPWPSTTHHLPQLLCSHRCSTTQLHQSPLVTFHRCSPECAPLIWGSR